MRMARLNIYFPDDLARTAKASGLNISGLAQEAVRAALAAAATDHWVDSVAGMTPLSIDWAQVTAAVASAKDDLEYGRG